MSKAGSQDTRLGRIRPGTPRTRPIWASTKQSATLRIPRRKDNHPSKATIDERFFVLERDGITYSALAAFRDCRELARLGTILGWSRRTSGLPLVFGSVVHGALERIYGLVQHGQLSGTPDQTIVAATMDSIDVLWREENPVASAETMNDFELTMTLAEAILPAYFNFWKHDDFGRFRWHALEHEFRLPVAVDLPPLLTFGGWKPRTFHTFIRGKMDGLFERDDKPGVRLLETKTKGRIEVGNLEDILPHQLQPGIYLSAARRIYHTRPVAALLNIIRRPQLRQKVAESLKQFAQRVADDIRQRPDFYFIRLEMEVSLQDYHRFDADFEDLMRDYILWYLREGPHYKNDGHCENKYGTCPMLPICGRKFFQGHFVRDKVFSELDEI